jgi:hypothetical protein
MQNEKTQEQIEIETAIENGDIRNNTLYEDDSDTLDRE